MADLPRLAEGTTAEGFARVQKLLDVRIENGWVHGTLPNAGDDESHWSPWDKYYSNPSDPPFVELLGCGKSDRDVVSFLQSYGAIVEDHRRQKGRIAFPVTLFHLEKWQFSFLVELHYSPPENLGDVFLDYLGRADMALRKFKGLMERGPWGKAVRQVWYAVYRQEPHLSASSDGRADWTPALNALKSNLTKMKPAAIQKAARQYITRIITEKLKNLRLAFEITPSGPRLYAYSDDLLEGFYWMLADYFARQKRLSTCAACGSFFVGGGRYCPTKVECKELGRRRVDWENNKAKYNRNRRRKRLRLKRRKKGK
jgi:hypothetical protein